MKRNSGQAFWKIFLCFLIKRFCIQHSRHFNFPGPQTLPMVSHRGPCFVFAQFCLNVLETFYINFNVFLNFLSHAPCPTLNDAFSRKSNPPLIHLMCTVECDPAVTLWDSIDRANVKFQTFRNGPQVAEEHSAFFLAAFFVPISRSFPPISVAIESSWFYCWGMRLNLVNLTYWKRSFISTDLSHNMLIYWPMRLQLFTGSYMVINLQ